MSATLVQLVLLAGTVCLCRCATASIRVETNTTTHYTNTAGNWVDKQINCYLDNFNTSELNLTVYKDNQKVYEEYAKTNNFTVYRNVPGLMNNVSRVAFGKLLVTHRTLSMSGHYNFSVLWGSAQKPNFTSVVVYISSATLLGINYSVFIFVVPMYLVISKFQ